MSQEGPIHAVEESIERSATGVRILLTLIFLVAIRVVEMVLLAVIVFDLAIALVARRAPAGSVRRFSDRVLAYAVEVVRYLTYAHDAPPFPFRDFPEAPDAAAG